MRLNDSREYFEIEKHFKKAGDDLIKTFEKNGKQISAIISQKLNKTYSSEEHIKKAYYFILERYTPDFYVYHEKVNLEKQANLLKLEIENKYENFFEKYVNFKDFIQSESDSISRITKNTIRLNLIKNNKEIQKINRLILVDLNSELNEFLSALANLKQTINYLTNNLSLHLHSVYSDKYSKNSFDNHKKYKKLSLNDLETGDVILHDEYKYYKKSLVTLQIKWFSRTTIAHSSIYYGRENGRDLVFETSGRNRKVSFIGDFEPRPNGTRYIIMRHKNKFSKEEKEKLKSILRENIGTRYSVLKLYGVVLNYFLMKIFKSWFPFITVGKNIYFGGGVFCSETIADVYFKSNRNISNKEDLGMLAPVDIFNSYSLEIVGYIEKN